MFTDWQQWFADCHPDAPDVVARFANRRVRFHSLPGSKRYPENEVEYATVLERHNRILGELARVGEVLGLLSTGYSRSPEPVRSESELLQFDPHAVHWRTFSPDQGDDGIVEPFFNHVFISKWQWFPGTFDPLVRLIADDRIANVMILSLDGHWLLHPYDGGMDVIVASTVARDRLMERHSEWLSPREDGL